MTLGRSRKWPDKVNADLFPESRDVRSVQLSGWSLLPRFASQTAWASAHVPADAQEHSGPEISLGHPDDGFCDPYVSRGGVIVITPQEFLSLISGYTLLPLVSR